MPLKHGNTVGQRRSPEFFSWSSMRNRCDNSNDPAYPRYGGRGIAVCERWSEFAVFLADMGPRPAGTSLDRVDPNGNYEPGNCRWATASEQAVNRRSTRLVAAFGETLCIEEWARRTRVSARTITRRLAYMAPEQALAEPTSTTHEWHGRSMTVAAWERELGLSRGSIRQRMRRGWTFERAVAEPFVPAAAVAPARLVAAPRRVA